MKKTDLEKNKALKLLGKMKQGGTPARFASDTTPNTIDRRAQRKLDQAQGLVSFPVKINQTIIETIRARAAAEGQSTDQIIGELLELALTKQSADANLG